jgi:hypothetical protein
MMREVRAELTLRRLPSEVRASLSPAQEAAIKAAIVGASPDQLHPIDLRFTLPWTGGGAYVVVLAGREQRTSSRRHQERQVRPIGTIGNVIFLGSLAMLLILLVGGALSLG